jgi:hypothetical protein
VTIAEDLRAAAAVLRRDGWQQFDCGTVDGPKCALGALHYVASGGAGTQGDKISTAAYARAQLANNVVSKRVGVWFPIWNDRYGRTEQEVIATLEQIAKENDHG